MADKLIKKKKKRAQYSNSNVFFKQNLCETNKCVEMSFINSRFSLN